jgi:GTPase SAR1 family protein
MAKDYESCRRNLEELATWYQKADRNEATTRLQVIDRLFLDCLAWSKDDITAEESYNGDYADYTFVSTRKILIVEAKKEGNYFDLPAGKIRIEYALTSLSRDFPNVKSAVEQVASYCQQRGVPFGAIANGHQIIAFIGNRIDGLPPLEGKALVFPSFDVMLKEFPTLWDALSKPGVEENRIQALLTGDSLPELPPKLSATISDYPGNKQRNFLQTDLQIVSELVIEDLAKARDLEARFLQECYCQSGALSQHALSSKAVLQARYSALFDSESPGPSSVMPAVNKSGEISSDLLADSFSRRPILLLGDVGVGKTTFIRHLINIEAATLFENALTLYIDLGSQATLTEDIKLFVPEEITRQLREEHEIDIDEYPFITGVYNLELQRFSKGLYSRIRETNPDLYVQKELAFLEEKVANREQHLKFSLEHISKARKKQVVIFLDNADQRSEQTQQEVFLVSQELAERWTATVYVALRPETFHRSKRVGALSAYHPKAFTISPPRIDRVIEKRLLFGIKITNGEIPIRSVPGTIQGNFVKLSKIMGIFLSSLRVNNELIEFIDNISGGNVRVALDIVKEFFGSGHVDTQKILDIYDESGGYKIPIHEIIRAVMFGDSEHYHPDQSPIANVFDVSSFDTKEHFLLPITISILATTEKPRLEGGFIETSKLYEHLQGLGFTPDQIDIAIARGFRKKLLETSARRIPEPGHSIPQALRATNIGRYHIERLCNSFEYIDAIVVDTPVFDNDIRDSIHDERYISERLDRANTFRDYLDKCWNNHFSKKQLCFNWHENSKLLCKQINSICAKIENH